MLLATLAAAQFASSRWSSERNGGTLGVPDATTPPMRAGRRVIHAAVACRYRNGDGQCQLCSFLYLVPNRRQHSPRTLWPVGRFRHRTRWQGAGRHDWRVAAVSSTVLTHLGLLAASVTAPAGSKLAATTCNCRTPGRVAAGQQHGPRTPWPVGSFRHRTRWQQAGRHDMQLPHPRAGCCRPAAWSSHPLGLLAASVTAPAGSKLAATTCNCRTPGRVAAGQQHGPRTPWPAGSFRHRTRWQQAGRHDMQLPHPRAGCCRPAAWSSHPLACWQLPSPHPLAASWPPRHATAAPPGGLLPASSTVLAPLGLLAASVTAPAGRKLAATTCKCRTLAGSRLLQLLPWPPAAARCSFVPPTAVEDWSMGASDGVMGQPR